MAEGEIYRVEIPIIVDDQTGAPKTRRNGKVSHKFEKIGAMETEKNPQTLSTYSKVSD